MLKIYACVGSPNKCTRGVSKPALPPAMTQLDQKEREKTEERYRKRHRGTEQGRWTKDTGVIL